MVAVTIGRDQGAIGQEADLGHAAHIVGVEAALGTVGGADFAQELTVLGEFQDEAVVITASFAATFRASRCAGTAGELLGTACGRAGLGGAIGAEPDIAFFVDRHAMVGRRPVMAGDRTPMMLQSALFVEFQNVGGRRAAIRFMPGEIGFFLVQRARTMNDPDIVVRIGGEADRRANDPAIGQRLGPIAVGFEQRHHRRLGIGAANDVLVEHGLADGQRGHHADQACAQHEFLGTQISHKFLPLMVRVLWKPSLLWREGLHGKMPGASW